MFLYLTGGLAVGEVDASYTGGVVGGPVGAINVNSTREGWTVGAGGEGRLGQSNWTLKLEYLYMDFGSVSGAVAGTGAPVKTFFGINNTDLIHFLTTTTTIAGIASTTSPIRSYVWASTTNFPHIDATGTFAGNQGGAIGFNGACTALYTPTTARVEGGQESGDQR